MEVRVYHDDIEKALKISKRKLANEGFFKELKKRRYYEKPSVKRKNKQREARRRKLRELRRRQVHTPSF